MRDDTRTAHAGRRPAAHAGTVNMPPYRASTILYPDLAAFRNARALPPGEAVTYGVHGTPGTYALEEAITALEGGHRTRLAPSGLVAISGPLLAYLRPGDHLLVADTVYGPTRSFCNGMLRRLGVETEFYDPCIGGAVAAHFQPRTRAVFMESPGSLTFEVQDVAAITATARAHGILTMLDNTWATPLFFKPLALGVDVSIHAATKYIGGHSDLVMGTVTTNAEAYPQLRDAWAELGLCTTADDAWLALRGLRSLPARLARHQQSALQIARWLQERAEVATVLHPALPDDPGHALWKRDFTGSTGLFGFTLRPELSAASSLAAMLDGLRFFGMGYSWGGYESLLIPVEPQPLRSATCWPRPGVGGGQLLRIHVGLEDPADLLEDLEQGFARLRGA